MNDIQRLLWKREPFSAARGSAQANMGVYAEEAIAGQADRHEKEEKGMQHK